MSAALLARPLPVDGAAVIGDTPDILGSIADPAVQLAVWARGRPSALDWIDRLEWVGIDDIDTSIAGPDYATAVHALLGEAGYPQTVQGEALCAEISDLSERFARLMSSKHLRLRLEVIDTDACCKWHMDYVTARLLMSFSGQGTQWTQSHSTGDVRVNQLGCGDVGIFKGRLSVEEPVILHRSPPVAALGEIRLLCVLDPLTGAQDRKGRA
ncbi:MAG: DUF1826 domain-containing protein [Sphingobium sp.]